MAKSHNTELEYKINDLSEHSKSEENEKLSITSTQEGFKRVTDCYYVWHNDYRIFYFKHDPYDTVDEEYTNPLVDGAVAV